MEVKEIKFKRFIARKGYALKWHEDSWDYIQEKAYTNPRWSPHSAIIDVNGLVGEVEEIPMKQYKDETKSGICGTCFC